MKKIILLFFVFAGLLLKAQKRYWVFFTDKNGVKFNPYEYFDEKAIERRQAIGYSLYDSTDFPVKEIYIEAVRQYADTVRVISRWFNAVSVEADQEELTKISALPFVKKIRPVFLTTYPASFGQYDTTLNLSERMLLQWQVSIFADSVFKKNNLNGKGVRIAVFDEGFRNLDNIPVFKYLFDNHKIIKTFDFTRNKEYVYSYGMHGTAVLSCIAGKINDYEIGLAPEAEFLLARTEVKSEPFSEEENWLAAVEWADKNGAQIINSSLGYTYHRYYPYQMDGETSLVADAANMAARKGILVVNAMGNDGDKKWKFLGTPADADSVFSIGGVSFGNGLHINFSSFGPNARCITKPDVCAPGEVIAAAQKGLKHLYGTSFATPLVTGFAACVMQKYPDKNQWQIKNLIKKSASLYPYYDYAHGYGVPNAKKLLEPDSSKHLFDLKLFESGIKIIFDKKQSGYLFYHFRKPDGCILEYYTIDLSETKHYEISFPDFDKPYILSVHFGGQTAEIKFEN